ncbi:MAG: hypothetical protein NC191_02875 [Muribaculaceae bacterium]|nr:hypothetical protein [Muribaculaceae bacterium]
MGLADRFKDSLEKKDLFQSSGRKSAVSEVKLSVKNNESKMFSNPSGKLNNFDDLETDIINKIRKTPYWSEYSTMEQRKMISAYFCRKLKDAYYSGQEKEEFVQNILILSNNK